MYSFEAGDRVRIDIPDTEDIDFELHGSHGEVVMVFEDDAGSVSGTEADSVIYRVNVDDYERTVDLRGRDLRPPLEKDTG